MASTSSEIRIKLIKANYSQWGLEFIQRVNGEITVKNIIDGSVASHSDIRIGDVLLSINGQNAETINLQGISSYFMNVPVVDLVVRRVVPATTRPPMITPSKSTTREVIDLLDDDDDDLPVPPRVVNTPSTSTGAATVPSASRPAVPASSSGSSAVPRTVSSTASRAPEPIFRRQQSEVIDLVSTDDEQDNSEDLFGDDSSEEDMPISTLMANRAAVAAAATRNEMARAATVPTSTTVPRNVPSQPQQFQPVRQQAPVAHQAPHVNNQQSATRTNATSAPMSPSLLGPTVQNGSRALPAPGEYLSITGRPTAHSAAAAAGVVGQKRALEAASTAVTSSTVKKLKIGKIEVKQEFITEPKGFGECNVGDEVVEVRGLDDDGEDEDKDSKDGDASTKNGDTVCNTPASSVKGGTGATPSVMDLDDDDADIMILGGNMQTAGDMPHQRESCTIHPFYFHSKTPQLVFKNDKYCPNCYCYVCDVQAKFCCEWSEHCHATYKEPKWKLEKQGRTSRIMNLMPPESRVAFFAKHRQYMNTRNANSIKGYFSGTPNDRTTGTSHISPTDKNLAGEMIGLVRSKLLDSQSSNSQTFLEGAALLLKLITWPTFPAWEFEAVPQLFINWLFHSSNTSEIRSIFREEINGMLMSRSCTSQFRQLVKLLSGDLKYSWLNTGGSNNSSSSSSSSVPRGPPPEFLKVIADFDFGNSNAILSEFSRLNRFADLATVVNNSTQPSMARVQAMVHLIHQGGIERINNAADLIAGVTNFTYAPEFNAWSRIPQTKMFAFLAHLIDINFVPNVGEGVQRCRTSAAFEFIFMDLASNNRLDMNLQYPVVQKRLGALLEPLQGPPALLSEWLKSVLISSAELPVGEEAAVLGVLLLSYLSRRISTSLSGAKSLAVFRGAVRDMTDRCVNPAADAFALAVATAVLNCKFSFASSASLAIQQVDMKLFIGCCIARKLIEKLRGVSMVAPEIKVEWSTLPHITPGVSESPMVAGSMNRPVPLTASFQFLPVSGNLMVPMMSHTSSTGSLVDSMGPFSVGSSGAVPPPPLTPTAPPAISPYQQTSFVSAASLIPSTTFYFDFSAGKPQHQQQQQTLVVNFNSPYNVLKGVLHPPQESDASLSLVSHRLMGNNLDFGFQYLVARTLSSLALSHQYTSLVHFVDANIALCRVLWKNFVVSAHLAVLDESSDRNKLQHFAELVSAVSDIVKRFSSRRAGMFHDILLDPDASVVWYQQLSQIQKNGGAAVGEQEESLILSINLHSIALCSTVQSNEPQTYLRSMKKFFTQTVCVNDALCLRLHHYYLLGHLTVYRKELWNDFWSPLICLYLKSKAYPSPLISVLLEEWDRLKSSLTGNNTEFGKLLVQDLYALTADDFDAIDRNMGAKRLIELVDGVCQNKELLNTISNILLNGFKPIRRHGYSEAPHLSNENSALAAVVKRLPLTTIQYAAMGYAPYFALILRDFQGDPSEEKRVSYETVKNQYLALNGKAVAENVILCLCHMSLFEIACPLILNLGSSASAELLKKALMHCESLQQFESAVSKLEQVLANCYLNKETVTIMEPLIHKFTAMHSSQLTESSSLFFNPPFALLIFFHKYDEDSFYGYWMGERTTDTRTMIDDWLRKIETSDRVCPRKHIQILFRFYTSAELRLYFAQMDYKNCRMNREEVVMALLDKLSEAEDTRDVLCLAIAKFLLHMPVLNDGIRSALVALNKTVVDAVAGLTTVGDINDSGEVQSTTVEDRISTLSINIAVPVLLCLNAPTDLNRIQSLKRAVEKSPLSARIFALLKDFSQPGPTVAMLLVDREFAALTEFLVELTNREPADECRLLCQAVDQLTKCLSAECIVPANETPSTPGRATKPSQEQCHREFFRRHGLIRSIGRFIALAAEKANGKDLSTRLQGMARMIETSVDAFVQKVFDLTSFDMMIFYYLKLCFSFNASHFSTFVSHYNTFGYFNVLDADSGRNSNSGSSSSNTGAGGPFSRPTSSGGLSIAAPESGATSAATAGAVGGGGEVGGGGALVNEIVEMIVTQPSNYMSDLKKMDELFNIYVNQHIILRDNVACFATLPSFTVLIERIFQKPTAYDQSNGNSSPLKFPKGMLWIKPAVSVPAYQAIRQQLDALVLKYQATAVSVFEGPLLTGLIDKEEPPRGQQQQQRQQQQQPGSLQLNHELRNFHTRKLLQDMSKFITDGTVGTNDLWTYLCIESWPVNGFAKIKFTLMKLINKPTFSSWLALVACVLRSFILGYGGGMRLNEALEIIFFRFKYMGCDQGLFTAAVQEELLSHIVANRPNDLKSEIMSGDYTKYKLSDIMAHPKLLGCLSFDNADILYEPSQFNLWRELLKSEKKVEMAQQFLKVFLNVVQFVASERVTQRLKSMFESFVMNFRACFNGFGEGAGPFLLSAKTEAKAKLKNKPAVLKLLTPLDVVGNYN